MITKLAEDIISKAKETTPEQAVIAAAGILSGGAVAGNALTSSDFTGREKLYHGTTAADADAIRRDGLRPTTRETARSTAILNNPYKKEEFEKSLGKAYTTKSKAQARMYAAQSDMHKATGKVNTANVHNLRPYLAKVRDENVVHVYAPTWKMNNIVANPEIGNKTFSQWKRSLGIAGAMQPAFLQKAMYNELKNNTVVFEGGVPTKYIKGSKDYQGLTLKEFLEHAAARKGNVAKALGKAGIGAGLMAAGPLAAMYYGRMGRDNHDN